MKERPTYFQVGMGKMGTAKDELIGIPFPEHSSELLNSLNEQRHKGLLCDVTIVTQGLEYRTHRAVLAACSQYFKKLFTSKSFSGQRTVCELDFVKPDVLAALLEFAYTATLTISNSNMREVLQAARLLEIQCVTDACIDILRSSGGEDEAEPPGGGGDDNAGLVDYAKARRYLDGFEEQIAGSPINVIEMLEVPRFRQRKRPKKPPRVSLNNRGNLYRIVQPLRTSMNNVIAAKQLEPPPDAPMGLQDQYSVTLDPQRGGDGDEKEYEEFSEDFGDQAEAPLYHRPPSPAERHTDDEGTELDSALYLSSLSNGVLSNVLGSPDKLVRRRKSQMPQECPICHKVIHGAGKLPRHMRTHTGEKPFACEVCGVRFTRNDKLKIHMRKHTGERPYCCSCCDARFLHSYDLKNHARLHTGDRPFECSQCRKAFVRLDHLQRHLKGQNCLEIRTRRRKGDGGAPADCELGPDGSGLPDEYEMERERSRIDGAFPEEYEIKHERPGIDGFPDEYEMKRERPGIDGFPEEFDIKREHSGIDGFPEEYEIKRERPGADGFPEEFEVKRERPGADGFPEEFVVKRERPGTDGFPEEYETKRERPGIDGFPEEYQMKTECPQSDGNSDVDGMQDWGHVCTAWDHEPEEEVLVDPS
uniref:zinc finger and BTB domain-containing protein 7B-like isoform X1 n=2 Tax=Pristiophorus japonicus TaxID=55135 RepID=UPI00398E327B